jgi:hypothetical protein
MCAPVRGAAARGKKDLLVEIWRTRKQTCGHPQKAVSGNYSEQDGCASGFAWFAREPKLIFGAEGRASSQRSIDYHKAARIPANKFDANSGSVAGLIAAGGISSLFANPALNSLDATSGWFDARWT